VYSLVAATPVDKMPTLERWREYLDDLIPEKEPDPDGVPVALEGVFYAHDEAKRFAAHHPDSILATLAEHLERLHQLNRGYQKKIAEVSVVGQKAHTQWRIEVVKLVDKIKTELAKIQPADEER
jgi:hypothetical protein